MNCLNFDMNECNFSDKIMAIKDRNGQSREGSSRVALAKATGLTYCYTLEFNYHSGRRINTLAPKYARTTGTIEGETELTEPQSKDLCQSVQSTVHEGDLRGLRPSSRLSSA